MNRSLIVPSLGRCQVVLYPISVQGSIVRAARVARQLGGAAVIFSRPQAFYSGITSSRALAF